MILRVSDLSIVPGKAVTIYTQTEKLKNRTICKLDFTLTEPQREEFSRLTGIENVAIFVNNVGHCHCFDSFGNTFYSEKLKNRFCYCLKFGNNGAKEATNHFVFLNEPCCSLRYNPHGNNKNSPFTTPEEQK